MTNTYAINTTRGKEFEVEQELSDLGLKPWVPKRRDVRYIKEQRDHKWYDRPYVHKLIFCVIPAILWRDVVELKHVIGKPLGMSQRDLDGTPAHVNKVTGKTVPAIPGLRQFQEAVDAEYADAQRREANASYECLYTPGQALELLDGAFRGLPAQFQNVVKRAHDDYAKLRVNVQIFGRDTPVEIDPDKVRGAG